MLKRLGLWLGLSWRQLRWGLCKKKPREWSVVLYQYPSPILGASCLMTFNLTLLFFSWIHPTVDLSEAVSTVQSSGVVSGWTSLGCQTCPPESLTIIRSSRCLLVFIPPAGLRIRLQLMIPLWSEAPNIRPILATRWKGLEGWKVEGFLGFHRHFANLPSLAIRWKPGGRWKWFFRITFWFFSIKFFQPSTGKHNTCVMEDEWFFRIVILSLPGNSC